MRIEQPLGITSRLMPGFILGNGTVSIGYSSRPGTEGRIRYIYHIDLQADKESADGAFSWTADDLQSGCGGGSLQEGLASLCSFLGACAESIQYASRCQGSTENADMFPEPIGEWASQNADELGMLTIELEETPNLIIE
jgi:hypothetical protein